MSGVNEFANQMANDLLAIRRAEKIVKITDKADEVFRGQIKLVQNDHVVIGCGTSSSIMFFDSIKHLEVIDG